MSSVKITLMFLIAMISIQTSAFDRRYLHNASYDKTQKRHQSVAGILENLHHLVPYLKLPDIQKDPAKYDAFLDCTQVRTKSAPHLGAIDPGQIRPNENTPGPFFFTYFESCVFLLADIGFSNAETAQQNAQMILGSELSRAVSLNDWSSKPFAQFPQELKNRIVDRMMLFVVGPEDVLLDYGYFGPDNLFKIEMNSQIEFRQFVLEIFQRENPNDTLLMFYKRFATFLRLGGAIKH